MKRLDLTIRGTAVRSLPSAFHDIDADRIEFYDGDGFVVAVRESHYRVEGTEVTATIVMELTDETTCAVTIMGGGGGTGVFGYKMTAESEELDEVRREIETFCDDRDLTVEES
jgi:hypothetical protein